jgi:hypothetical protein
VTTADDGTEAMTDVGTESGTLVHETIATDGDEAATIIWVDGKLETNESGTTTGDDQVDGTVTVCGTETATDETTYDENVEAATVRTADDGTEATTDVGTDDGTFDQATITTDGDEWTKTTWVDGKLETKETATTTGDDHVDGIVTVAGTDEAATATDETTYDENDEAATVTTAELGIEAMRPAGTDDGTFDQAMMTADGDEWIVMITLDGSDETAEAGTTTGDDHVDGTATVAGT